MSFAVAFATVAHPRAWRVSRHLFTAAHEGGHALATVLTGRRLIGIRLHADASGTTVSTGHANRLNVVATSAAGYLTPPLLGLGAAWLVRNGHAITVLWISIVLAVSLLAVTRNLFGLVSVSLWSALVLAVAGWGPPSAQRLFVWTLTWTLLLGGPRPVWELHRARSSISPTSPTSDAAQLATFTHIPALMWEATFAAAAVACLGLGGQWLLLSVIRGTGG